jgi:hypothetical protein
MTALDEQIEALSALLRAQGGVVQIDPDAPDHVKQAWLKMILDRPDGRKEMRRKKDERSD